MNNDRNHQAQGPVRVLRSERGSRSCDNLSWHTAFSVDQRVGSDQFAQLMEITTQSALERLKWDWNAPDVLQSTDIYAMQLLHCYDLVSERPSPFETCFTSADWEGFEYLRDTKYHFSEGYGRAYPGFYAIPWLKACLTTLRDPAPRDSKLPLRVAFTHREEVLYLCCLLGVNYEKGWQPNIENIDASRAWKTSILAPYLGHVGMESYLGNTSQKRVRLIVNGQVRSGFHGLLEQDSDGGYDLDQVDQWASMHYSEWEGFSKSSITFLR